MSGAHKGLSVPQQERWVPAARAAGRGGDVVVRELRLTWPGTAEDLSGSRGPKHTLLARVAPRSAGAGPPQASIHTAGRTQFTKKKPSAWREMTVKTHLRAIKHSFQSSAPSQNVRYISNYNGRSLCMYACVCVCLPFNFPDERSSD